MPSRVIPVEEFDLVIFGGTGDLSRRKILPGLFRRYCQGQMTKTSRIIGAARSDLSEHDYRAIVRAAIEEFGGSESRDTAALEAFLGQIHYLKVDASGDGGWSGLAITSDRSSPFSCG